MINLKTVFAIALLSASTTTMADEVIIIDTQELHADISAELALGIEQMQQNLHEDTDAMLIADKKEQQTANTEQSKAL